MKQWYALKSKPKRESSAAALLARAGIQIYLPRIQVHKRQGKPPVLEPFFPGSLFSQLDALAGEIRLASYTPGVLYVVGYGDQPCPVPDDLVVAIRNRLERDGGCHALPNYRAGDRLVITSGPLRDVEAVFDCHVSATGRVRVLVNILDRLCRAELHVGQVRRANKAVGIAKG